MKEKNNPKLKKYIYEVIVGVALLSIGCYLGKYIFHDKPELTFKSLKAIQSRQK